MTDNPSPLAADVPPARKAGPNPVALMASAVIGNLLAAVIVVWIITWLAGIDLSTGQFAAAVIAAYWVNN